MMKKQILLSIALLISFGSMAQTKINFTDKNKVKHTYTKKVISIVSTDDGKTFSDTSETAITAAKVKSIYDNIISKPPVIIPPVITQPVPNIVVTPVNGKTLDLGMVTKNTTIKPGIYDNIYFVFSKANDVTIDFTGVTFKNSVVETGSGNNVTLLNLTFDTQKFRPLRFDFGLNNLTIKGFKFINCDDYIITANNSNITYNGTDATLNKGFKLIDCSFDNSGQITLGGSFNKETNEDTGLFKDVEIAGNTFKNSSPGAAVSLSNVWGYDLHHNVVDGFNASNNNHNGIFFMQGSGKFHDNLLTNYQGNSIRMWLYSRGSIPTTNEIYNNICFNTRKYGAFELQAYDRNMWPGKSTYANAKVYNNTVGQMSASKDWEGQILDLYSIGGSLEFYNNLGFNLVSGKAITNMINKMSDVKVLENNNIYRAKQEDAITPDFKSKVKDVGASF